MTSSGQAWTLIARFSNNDAKNWMKDNGEWWYDKSKAVGKGISPSENTDMLSPAFWFVSGLEFKITRSDDPHHTALLQTTGNCLGKQTFRQKIESYGSFKDGTVLGKRPLPGKLQCSIWRPVSNNRWIWSSYLQWITSKANTRLLLVRLGR